MNASEALRAFELFLSDRAQSLAPHPARLSSPDLRQFAAHQARASPRTDHHVQVRDFLATCTAARRGHVGRSWPRCARSFGFLVARGRLRARPPAGMSSPSCPGACRPASRRRVHGLLDGVAAGPDAIACRPRAARSFSTAGASGLRGWLRSTCAISTCTAATSGSRQGQQAARVPLRPRPGQRWKPGGIPARAVILAQPSSSRCAWGRASRQRTRSQPKRAQQAKRQRAAGERKRRRGLCPRRTRKARPGERAAHRRAPARKHRIASHVQPHRLRPQLARTCSHGPTCARSKLLLGHASLSTPKVQPPSSADRRSTPTTARTPARGRSAVPREQAR